MRKIVIAACLASSAGLALAACDERKPEPEPTATPEPTETVFVPPVEGQPTCEAHQKVDGRCPEVP